MNTGFALRSIVLVYSGILKIFLPEKSTRINPLWETPESLTFNSYRWWFDGLLNRS